MSVDGAVRAAVERLDLLVDCCTCFWIARQSGRLQARETNRLPFQSPSNTWQYCIGSLTSAGELLLARRSCGFTAICRLQLSSTFSLRRQW
jgi:hypothetical protein